MKYCLYYGHGRTPGQRPGTVLAQVEIDDGHNLIVRAVDKRYKPRVKHGKRITYEDVAHWWDYQPLQRDVRAARSNLPMEPEL